MSCDPTPAATPAAPQHHAWHRLRVTRLARPGEDSVAITLAVPPSLADAFTYRAGQHVTVRHHANGRELRRSYSLCPPPGDPGALRLVVKHLGPGGFADHATRVLAEGDDLDIGPPTGSFRLASAAGAHHVMVAGGSGITPLLTMAAGALRQDPLCRVSLLYASRDARSVLLADELADLKDAHVGRFAVLHVFSRETQGAGLLSGHLDTGRLRALLSVLDADPAAGGTHFYLCGPGGLVTTARTALTGWGAAAGRVRLELFTPYDAYDPDAYDPDPYDPSARPASAAAPAAGRRVTAHLGGRTTTTTTQPQDTSLLDAVVRALPEVPYSCRDGLCGTCRAKVRTGAVHMSRQFALGPEELDEGYVLACRAAVDGDEAELDFDA